MNEAIEFHDSDVDTLTEQAGEIVVSLRAYVHRSTGQPGVDAGTGWIQPALLTIGNAHILERPLCLPQTIWEASLQVDQEQFPDLSPVNGILEGELLFKAIFQSGDLLTIRGQRAWIQWRGEPRFVENFPG